MHKTKPVVLTALVVSMTLGVLGAGWHSGDR